MLKVYIAILIAFIVLKILTDLKILSEKKACVVVLLVVLFITMFRQESGVGSDDYNYRLGVLSCIGTSLDWQDVFAFEGGNYLLQWICAQIFGFSQPFIALESLFTVLCLWFAIMKFSEYRFLSLYIFCISGSLSSIMNISRQYMAIAIITYFAYTQAQRKKFIWYALFVLLAAWFHTSALVMLPMYFFLRRDKPGAWGIVIAVATVIVMGNFTDIVTAALGDTHYEYVAEENSMNILRTVKDVVVVLAIMLSMVYENGVKKPKNLTVPDTPDNSIQTVQKNAEKYASMMFVAAFMTLPLTFLAQANLYVYRLTGYFDIGVYALLPTTKKIFTVGVQKYYIAAMVVLFAIFGWISMSGSDLYHNILFETLEYGTEYGAAFIR